MKIICCILIICLTGCIDLVANEGKNKQQYLQTLSQTRAQVYTMRGGLGGIFSRGMNHLQDTLKKDRTVYASSTVWYKAYSLSQFIIEQKKLGKTHGPIVLVGHSLGANEQIKVAKQLERANICVDLLITVDAVSPTPVPENVKRAINIYKPSFIPLFSGQKLKAKDPRRTKIENISIDKQHISANHFSIDGNEKIQGMMITAIHETLARKVY